MPHQPQPWLPQLPRKGSSSAQGPRVPAIACCATTRAPPAHSDSGEPEDRLTSLVSAPPRPLPQPPAAAGGANAALRCSQGGGWKFEPLLGEELDLRRITWRLPPELIPRLSASSGRSSDGEPPRGPPDDRSDAGTGGEGGGLARGATPRPPGGDGLARPAPTPHPARHVPWLPGPGPSLL